MENINRNKSVFSSSGITPFKRFLEYEREFVKAELGKKVSIVTIDWTIDLSLDDFNIPGYYVINSFREYDSEEGSTVRLFVVDSGTETKSISQIFYAVDKSGNVLLKQRCFNVAFGWGVWKNIISEDNSGSLDWGDFEKQLYKNSEAINSEVERAITAEEVINDKINQIDDNVLRLMQKAFPLTVKLSCVPSASVLNEYTGEATEFTFSWVCSVDGVTVPDADIESIKFSYNGNNILLPEEAASSYKIVLSDTATVSISITSQGMTATSTAKVTFGHRWYSGVVDSDFVLNENSLSALLQQGVGSSKTQTLSYTSFSLKRIVYAFVAKYGELSAIVDANNINLIDNYTLMKVTQNGVEYNVYITTEEFSVTGNVTYKYQ